MCEHRVACDQTRNGVRARRGNLVVAQVEVNEVPMRGQRVADRIDAAAQAAGAGAGVASVVVVSAAAAAAAAAAQRIPLEVQTEWMKGTHRGQIETKRKRLKKNSIGAEAFLFALHWNRR